LVQSLGVELFVLHVADARDVPLHVRLVGAKLLAGRIDGGLEDHGDSGVGSGAPASMSISGWRILT
jgi:hypothetical protein